MNNKRGSIYCGINRTNGMMYIGQTRDQRPNYRISKHKRAKSDSYFHRSIRESGIENFDFIWFHYKTVDLNNLNDLEQYYIQKYNTIDPNGYNRYPGGYYESVIINRSPQAQDVILDGESLRIWRKENLYTQHSLAKILGCTTASIQNWEKERTEIRGRHRQSWINCFGFDPSIRFSKSKEIISENHLENRVGILENQIKDLELRIKNLEGSK